MIGFLEVGAIVLGIFAIINYIKRYNISSQTVVGVTGGLGSGKSYLCVLLACRAIGKARFHWFLKFLKCKLLRRSVPEKPYLYSNIPIKSRAFRPLTREHLLCEDRIEEYSIVMIDEIGSVASQYDFDNPNVVGALHWFVRFFRHIIGGRFFINDQSSSNIVKCVRVRLNVVYNLENFRRWFKITPWCKIDIEPLKMSEDIQNTNNVSSRQKKEFLFFLAPYRWIKFLRRYDSRCYSIIYDCVPKINSHEGIKIRSDLKTNRFISLEISDQQVKKLVQTGKYTLKDLESIQRKFNLNLGFRPEIKETYKKAINDSLKERLEAVKSKVNKVA